MAPTAEAKEAQVNGTINEGIKIAARIAFIIVACEAVEVDAAFVAEGIAGDEAACEAVVEAVGQAQQARTRVGVVAVLTAEADGVVVSSDRLTSPSCYTAWRGGMYSRIPVPNFSSS